MYVIQSGIRKKFDFIKVWKLVFSSESISSHGICISLSFAIYIYTQHSALSTHYPVLSTERKMKVNGKMNKWLNLVLFDVSSSLNMYAIIIIERFKNKTTQNDG